MTDFDAGAAAARAVGDLADRDVGDAAADAATDAVEATTDAATDAATDTDNDSSTSTADEEIGLMDVLMHTKPDLSVDEVQDRLGVGPAGANAVVGVRKVAHRLTGSGGSDGTPAIINFATAGYLTVNGLEDNDVDDSGGGEDADRSTNGDAPSIGGVSGA
ncbi:hypothetical protein SAMN04488063_0103 [Halopelagius inordinatus]|uniref:Uncharacterized protein n=1 Tax=Halopelagius inordinatus TaxID=553467 RepID=A0A1I2X4I3_9EURY|nr:hypothetical protein [Halopelagius inordinatus]SFH07606.1 hypothetical protein SAMN04488063_0103 [Halopelagius inordinatus]